MNTKQLTQELRRVLYHESKQMEGLRRGSPEFEQACGRVAREMFGAFRAIIVDCMIRGEDVQLESLGTFRVAPLTFDVEARRLPNRRATDLEKVKAVRFSASKSLKEQVNRGKPLVPRWHRRKETQALGAKTKKQRATALQRKREAIAAAPPGILGLAAKRVGPHPNHRPGGRGIGRYRYVAEVDPFS